LQNRPEGRPPDGIAGRRREDLTAIQQETVFNLMMHSEILTANNRKESGGDHSHSSLKDKCGYYGEFVIKLVGGHGGQPKRFPTIKGISAPMSRPPRPAALLGESESRRKSQA
jgi:hypothetical protein